MNYKKGIRVAIIRALNALWNDINPLPQFYTRQSSHNPHQHHMSFLISRPMTVVPQLQKDVQPSSYSQEPSRTSAQVLTVLLQLSLPSYDHHMLQAQSILANVIL